jgi:hypothetical protein
MDEMNEILMLFADAGRSCVLANGGCVLITGLLRRLLDLTANGSPGRRRQADLSVDVSSTRYVVVGCLLNLVCDYEHAQLQVRSCLSSRRFHTC